MAFDPRNGLHQGWCLTLLDEFETLRQRHAILHRLARPNLVVSPNLSTTLGQWDEETRQIRLSARLLDEGCLAMIRAVFLHEVAHQIVSELYGIEAAQPHGEAFRRACCLLEIPAARELTFDDLTADGEHPLLRRVRKLMALGESPNRHEAEQALSKARALALKYNLDLLQKQGTNYQVRLVGPSGKRLPSYLWGVCRIINEYYFCEHISRSIRDPRDDSSLRVIEFYGLPENLDMAEYVYYFLLEQGEREWQDYRRENRLRNRRRRLSFLKGLYAGYADKLAEQEQQLIREKALVWQGDPGLTAFYRQRNPRVTTRKLTSRHVHEAHQAGVRAGRKIQVRPGLRQQSPKPGDGRKQLS